MPVTVDEVEVEQQMGRPEARRRAVGREAALDGVAELVRGARGASRGAPLRGC